MLPLNLKHKIISSPIVKWVLFILFVVILYPVFKFIGYGLIFSNLYPDSYFYFLVPDDIIVFLLYCALGNLVFLSVSFLWFKCIYLGEISEKILLGICFLVLICSSCFDKFLWDEMIWFQSNAILCYL